MTYAYHVLKDNPIGLWPLDKSDTAGTNLVVNPNVKQDNGTIVVSTNYAQNPSAVNDLTNIAGYTGTETLLRVTGLTGIPKTTGVQATMTAGNGVVFKLGNYTTGAIATGSLYVRLISGTATGWKLAFHGIGTGPAITLTSSWQRFDFTTTLSVAYTTSPGFGIINDANDTGAVIEVAAVCVEPQSYASTYFDGATSADSLFTYGWAGTANASNSTKWGRSSQGWNYNNANGSAATYRVPTGGYDGEEFWRVHWKNPSNSANSGGPYYVHSTNKTLVVPGKTYTASLYVRSSRAMSMRGAAIHWWDASTTQVGIVIGSPFTLVPNVWTRVSVTGTAPANTDNAVISCYNTTGNVWNPQDTVDMDAILVEEGTALHAFWDGNTPDTADVTYAWSGTPNLSQSTKVISNDASGYGNSLTYLGTPGTTRPIVAGGVAAQHLTSDDTVNYPIDSIMIAGRETRTFSLEAWIKPQSGTSAIIARDNSGLFLDGLVLRFSIQFGSLVSITYDHLDAGQIYHVVGVYDGKSMILYVNGQSVASTEIDDSVLSTGIADTTNKLKTTMTTSMVMDTPAVYNYGLDYVRVNRHYTLGTDYPQVVNLSLNNGGKYYQFSDSFASVYDVVSFGDTDDWNSGTFTGSVAVVDNKLVNLFDETSGDWLTGTWTYQYSVASDDGAGITLNGSRITWESLDAITVEISTDDVTWTPVANGDSIVGTQSLASGYAIAVRVTIPTTTDAQSVVDNLKIVFYTSKSVKGSDETLLASFNAPLTVTLSDTTYPPASFNDNAGVLLPASNGISIPADTDFDPYAAVEMTVKFDTSTASKTVLSIGSASITSDSSGRWVFTGLTALYVDGDAVTSPFAIETGKWHHVLAVFAPTTDIVYIGNSSAGSAGYPMRVGYVALYADTIDSTTADAIYDTWVGMAAIQVNEENVSGISEHIFSATSSPFRAYSFDWSITGAG